jgi:hypothetical protein
MSTQWVNPTRGFVDNSWSSMKLIVDNSYAKGDQRKILYDRYGGSDGVEFRDLGGPINGALLATNNTICAPVEKIVPISQDKVNTLNFWSYPNGEFSYLKMSHDNVHYQHYEANGNPNGGVDNISLQPTQTPNPTIPSFPQPNSPNVNKQYASYRTVGEYTKDTNWSTPQYFRTAYNASDMECAISTKKFVKSGSGPRGDFALLQFQNGYKLLSSDKVTVVKNTDPGDGTPIVVTCNPGIGARDSSSQTWVNTMAEYCGNGDTSYYKDSRYNAYPNPDRQDADGNKLGYGTLARFDSPVCQNFCTQYPLACKKPFQQWCIDIKNWTPTGTCYATANIVKDSQQTAVVPTLENLCTDKNLDTDVCKTFCFQNNTSTLNCGPALKKYCSGLVKDELRKNGQITVSQSSASVNSTYAASTNTYTLSSGTTTPFVNGESVILSDTSGGGGPFPNYNYINSVGYIAAGVVNIPLGINLTFHGLELVLTSAVINTTNINLSFNSGTTVNFPVGSQIYIWGGTTNAAAALLGGRHVVTAFNATAAPNYVLSIKLSDAPTFPTGTQALPATTILMNMQPLVYGPDGKQWMPFNRTGWTPSGGGAGTTKFLVTDTTANLGSAAYTYQLEINVFNFILNSLTPNTFQLALEYDYAGTVAPGGIPTKIPYYFGDIAATSQTVSLFAKLGATVTQPANSTSSNPYIKKSADGAFVSYSNDAVAAAAKAVYAAHNQCPCFMPTFVYNHYYNDLLSQFPTSPKLNAFVQNIVTKPHCTYPQCAVQNNGATNYSPRVIDSKCPDVSFCLSNAEISVESVGYLAKTNFMAGDPNDINCNMLLSTFSIYEDTRLLSPNSTTQSFYNTIYNNANGGVLNFKLMRATPTGSSNIPVIPPPPSKFRGWIAGRTLIAAQRIRGVFPPELPANTPGTALAPTGNFLYGQGIRAGTFIDPAVPMIPYAAQVGYYQYSILASSPSQNVGSASRQIDITIEGNTVPTLYPCKATYFVQNTSLQKIVEYPYQLGDKVHVFESDVWQSEANNVSTPFLGFIADDPTDLTGGSILTVVSNQGPIAPGLMASINGVLPKTYIKTLLTGVGTPYTGTSSTWKLDTKYLTPLGSAASPVQMYTNAKSVNRFISGYVKDIYLADPAGPDAGYTFMSIECEETNEDINQLKWSNNTSDIRSMNSSGQLSTVYSIGRDKDDTEMPGGQPIDSRIWDTMVEPDRTKGIQYQPLINDKIVKESGQTVLIVMIVLAILLLMIVVGWIFIRRRHSLMVEMAKEKMETDHMNNHLSQKHDMMQHHINKLSEHIVNNNGSSSEFPSELS